MLEILNIKIITEEGETITSTFYEIVELTPAMDRANGIAIAALHINSTGRFAPLNCIIIAATDYMQPIGEAHTTFWEWIPSPPPLPPTTMEESPPSRPINETTADATAADTNATTATEEEQQ
ncbi:MAG TPA: hypothetical protein VKA87_07380 [Nitrososphaeraceae archaeon]|nr:hypothetical protein [Nitrososphaeraceae archaeon]